MSNNKIGLYKANGDPILEWDKFENNDFKFMYILTGWGSTGQWSIKTNHQDYNPGKHYK